MLSPYFFSYPIIHKVISNRSSPPARRAPWAFLLSNKCSVQSSVHPPPPKSGFRASALSFTSLSSIIRDVQWTQSSNWTGKLVASCAHLDNAHPPILPWKYFFYSSQRPLSAWCVWVYHQHYIPNLQVVFLFPLFLPSVRRR